MSGHSSWQVLTLVFIGISMTTATEMLIVTGYYPGPARHTMGQYRNWIRNFFHYIGDGDVAIYTPPSFLHNMTQLAHEGFPNRTRKYIFITDYTSALKFPTILPHAHSYVHEQHAKDPYPNKYTPHLYSVWNGKCFMITNLIDRRGGPQIYMWVDIGAFRSTELVLGDATSWPSYNRLKELVSDDNILFGLVKLGSERPIDPTKHLFGGGFFAGTASTMKWFCTEYYKLHDEMILRGEFVGKEETLMNMILLQYPERVSIIPSFTTRDPWFYFEPFLLSKDTKGLAGDRSVLNFTTVLKDHT